MVRLIMFGTPFNDDIFEMYYSDMIFKCTECLIISVCYCDISHLGRKLTDCNSD